MAYLLSLLFVASFAWLLSVSLFQKPLTTQDLGIALVNVFERKNLSQALAETKRQEIEKIENTIKSTVSEMDEKEKTFRRLSGKHAALLFNTVQKLGTKAEGFANADKTKIQEFLKNYKEDSEIKWLDYRVKDLRIFFKSISNDSERQKLQRNFKLKKNSAK